MNCVFNFLNLIKCVRKKIFSFSHRIKRASYLRKIGELKIFLRELTHVQRASLSYFPFVGWIYPLVVCRDDYFCKRHAKQGFVFSLIFVTAVVLLDLVNIFSPVECRSFRLGIVLIIYLIIVGYFLNSIIAIRSVLRGNNPDFKIIKRLVDLINL